MKIFYNIEEWIGFRRTLNSVESIGFVPTMGNLHAGHASLLCRSQKENEITVSSLFVNPTQFNQVEDFNNYPRTLKADLQLLENNGIDYCLLPNEKALYHDAYRYKIVENELCQLMEGKHRPGHFDGVLTVVMKLFNLVKPNKAYFGEKDYQQFLLIRDMAHAFFMDINVLASPTIREASGLAYSSRNNRLTSDQRILAENFANIFHQLPSCSLIIKKLQEEGIEVDYVIDYQGRRFAAVLIGNIRLIDNYEL